MLILKILLAPLGALYWCVIWFRNYLYDVGQKRSVHFDVPTVCVGNLALGGTGKTPHVEFLINWLKEARNITTLSRGYKRESDGLVFANEQSTAGDLGDEAYQVYSKFQPEINTAVCPDRAFGISMIAGELPDTDLIILDDAFQHRAVRYDFSIMISDFNRPFFDDYLIPFGKMRDIRKSANRADVVVFSKTPMDTSKEELDRFVQESAVYTKAPVFFTSIEYGEIKPVWNASQEMRNEVVLITGIANASYLKEELTKSYSVVHHFEFPDHHNFTDTDIRKINDFMTNNKDVSLVTTEKDFARLKRIEATHKWNLFVAPIEVRFLIREDEFKKLVLQHV